MTKSSYIIWKRFGTSMCYLFAGILNMKFKEIQIKVKDANIKLKNSYKLPE